MASTGYPKVPLKAWRQLRTKAQSAPTTKFTPEVVAAQAGMASPDSAATNIVGPMRRLGVFDKDGALTERGNKWRVDSTYAEACQEILEEVYPPDLAALTDDAGAPDSEKVRTWFDHKGFGKSNGGQMASTYVMIATKRPPEAGAAEPTKTTAKVMSSKKPAPTRKASLTNGVSYEAEAKPSLDPPDSRGPNVHLDIQIHIPADSTPEQIDHIFESMARHLYKQ